ncbi:sulfatase-like hydrolase/transferase, partial [Verrucomicrobiota bacterium]
MSDGNNHKRPNIVIIMSDQHTPNVTGCYGNNQVKTPNMDNLAKDGVMFENAYCNNPVCVPSRCSMLTGLYSHKINAWCNPDPLLPHLATWPLVLQSAGYETVISGRMHLVWGDRMGGFARRLYGDPAVPIPRVAPNKTMQGSFAPQGIDSRLGITENMAGNYQGTGPHDKEANQHAMNYLENEAREPFALYIGYYQPHAPFVAPKKYFDLYESMDPETGVNDPLEDIYLPLLKGLSLDRKIPEHKLKTAIRAYYAMVSQVDHLIGEIKSTLEKTGLLDNTILIYTSDHGEMLGRHKLWHKMCFYEDSVRVPLIISFPQKWGKDRKIAANVSLLDLFPTFLAMAGFNPDIKLDGQSLLPLLNEEKTGWDNKAIAESIGVRRGHPGRMLKRDNLKLILYHGQKPVLFDLEK